MGFLWSAVPVLRGTSGHRPREGAARALTREGSVARVSNGTSRWCLADGETMFYLRTRQRVSSRAATRRSGFADAAALARARSPRSTPRSHCKRGYYLFRASRERPISSKWVLTTVASAPRSSAAGSEWVPVGFGLTRARASTARSLPDRVRTRLHAVAGSPCSRARRNSIGAASCDWRDVLVFRGGSVARALSRWSTA